MEGNFTFGIDEEMNLTLTCAEKRLLGGPMVLSRTATDVFRYLQTILFVVGFPIGLVLNTLVIVLVAKFKSLQQISFYLALQVVVVDLLITLIQFPTTTANVIADRWVFGAAGCPTIGFFLFTFRNMRNFLMFVFVIDRLLSVFVPFWYYKANRRKWVVVPLSIAAWLFALIYGIIPMPIILDCHEYGRIAWGCTVSKGCKYPQICDNYKITSVLLSNIIGGLIPLVMYITLYCKARQIKKGVPANALSTHTVTNSLQQSTAVPSQEKRKQSIVSLLSNSTSDSSSSTNWPKVLEKRRKRDEKATVTFVILFIALVGVSFPSTFFFVIGTSVFAGSKPPEWFFILVTIFRTLFNFLVIIDPIAIMRNRDVKIVLRQAYTKFKYRLKKEPMPFEATNYTPKTNSVTQRRDPEKQ